MLSKIACSYSPSIVLCPSLNKLWREMDCYQGMQFISVSFSFSVSNNRQNYNLHAA
jgi:hypothetical protein